MELGNLMGGKIVINQYYYIIIKKYICFSPTIYEI